MTGGLDGLLAPYRQLVLQVDALCARITAEFAEQIACRSGCSSCCLLQSVFPVEAAHLHACWQQLATGEREAMLRAMENAGGDACPLLTDDRCPLYAARPLICRTHGLPILFSDDAGRRVDRCPENFTGVASLPGTAVIDLDRLNLLLAQVNRDFVGRFPAGTFPERLPLAEVFSFPWPATAP